MERQFNIVQIEFFLIDVIHQQSIEELKKELDEATEEILTLARHGIETWGIKPTVRFFDTTGVLTKFVVRAEDVSKGRDEALKKFGEAFAQNSKLKKIFWEARRQWLHRKMSSLRTEAGMLARAHLREAIERGEEVALQRMDRSFRPLWRQEVHELLEAAESSKNVWFFVFKPNELRADENKLIASFM